MKEQSDLGYIKLPKTRDEWANLCEYVKSLNEIFDKERKKILKARVSRNL